MVAGLVVESRDSVDGIFLGSNIFATVAKRGKPDEASRHTYKWRTQQGGSVTVATSDDGIVTVIDVIAGSHERRELDVPNGPVVLGETGHVNYADPPQSVLKDSCGAGLVGGPCEAYTLSDGTELIMNFGKDTGLADWALNEVIIGNRSALLQSGRIIGQ